MEKTLEIALDGSVRHTRYFVLNKEVNDGRGNDKFFEGTEIWDVDADKAVKKKRISPLKEAKIWAKENGYTHLQITRITRGKDKFYKL